MTYEVHKVKPENDHPGSYEGKRIYVEDEGQCYVMSCGEWHWIENPANDGDLN